MDAKVTGSSPTTECPSSPPLIAQVCVSGFENAVLKCPEPVVVIFRAAWCSLCKVLEPTLKSLADEKLGVIRFITVDVERNEALADQFLVRAVPTLLVFHRGVVEDCIVGRFTEMDLRDLLDRLFE